MKCPPALAFLQNRTPDVLISEQMRSGTNARAFGHLNAVTCTAQQLRITCFPGSCPEHAPQPVLSELTSSWKAVGHVHALSFPEYSILLYVNCLSRLHLRGGLGHHSVEVVELGVSILDDLLSGTQSLEHFCGKTRGKEARAGREGMSARSYSTRCPRGQSGTKTARLSECSVGRSFMIACTPLYVVPDQHQLPSFSPPTFFLPSRTTFCRSAHCAIKPDHRRLGSRKKKARQLTARTRCVRPSPCAAAATHAAINRPP